MLKLVHLKKFEREAKKAQKRGHDLQKLKKVVEKLAAGEKLDPKHRDHPLKGEFVNYRECHIEPDWLLIYKKTDSELILIRTGTHSDLF
jgi:mRNA interferase YafQ